MKDKWPRDAPTSEAVATNWIGVSDMQTVPRSARKSNGKPDKALQLRQQIDASLDTLAEAVDEVRASDIFRRYLDVQAKFHRYSWCNSMLIASQQPDATQVAGYRAWQKLGRQVRKGERGIAIFAPCPWKRENTDTGEEESGMFFRVAHVFDVAQTDGDELPTVDVPTIASAADDLLDSLKTVASKRGIAVAFTAQPGTRMGVSMHGSVEVAPDHPTGQQAKTLAHELAHEALHWEDRGPLTRSIAELEAESVAYVVCAHVGLDVEVRASRYIALWDGDSKALRASLERIADTARGLIDDLDAVESGRAL